MILYRSTQRIVAREIFPDAVIGEPYGILWPAVQPLLGIREIQEHVVAPHRHPDGYTGINLHPRGLSRPPQPRIVACANVVLLSCCRMAEDYLQQSAIV